MDIPLAEEASRRAVVELRVQPHEPGLGDLLAVVLADEAGHAERETQPRLDGGVSRAPAVVSVLLHGARLANASDVRHELGTQDVDQLLRDGLEGSPGRVVEGFEIGSRRRLAWSHWSPPHQ